MSEPYDKVYYNGGCGAYKEYEYGPKWKTRAASLMAAFPDAGTYLDMGCARGLLLRGYVENGVSLGSVFGVDVSEYATSNSDALIRERVGCCSVFDFEPNRQWGLVTAFDFLEHLPRERLSEAVGILEKVCSKHLHVMLMTERAEWDTDETHVSILPLEEWLALFSFEFVAKDRMSKSPHVTVATFRRPE